MIIPVRCISCGKPVAQLWEEYIERVKKGEDRKKVMDSLGIADAHIVNDFPIALSEIRPFTINTGIFFKADS